jgi:hypothetical protein
LARPRRNDNKIYNNCFIDNVTQAEIISGTGNVFNQDITIGGNYWSDYAGIDDDGNGFGDTSYTFSGGQDDLPLIQACGLSPVPQLECVGFEPPMAAGRSVTVKKNRALPHKAQLQNAEEYAVTGADITAAPVIQVLYESTSGADPEDVTDEALSAGMGSDGNQFVWTEEGKWQFNLKASNYTATGTYTVTMESGDDSEYVIDRTCTATFVIE